MKPNKGDFVFENSQDSEFLKNPGEINGQSFTCKNLKNCIVRLCDFSSTIYVIECQNCQFYFGPAQAAVFLRKSQNCILTSASQQLRISDSQNIQVFAFSETDLTIENSKGLILAPYNFKYNGISKHFAKVELNTQEENKLFSVMDFTPEQGNYEILNNEEFEGFVEFELGNEESKETPVQWPNYYGGNQDQNVFAKREENSNQESGMLSFKMNEGNLQGQQKSNEKSQQNIQNLKFSEVQEEIKKENQNTTKQNELEQKLNQRSQAKEKELEEKFKQELILKKEKREKGKKDLQEFLENYKKELKQKKQQEKESKKSNDQSLGWEGVKNNFSFKISDFKGQNDMSAFRRGIQGKLQDLGLAEIDQKQIIQLYQ